MAGERHGRQRRVVLPLPRVGIRGVGAEPQTPGQTVLGFPVRVRLGNAVKDAAAVFRALAYRTKPQCEGSLRSRVNSRLSSTSISTSGAVTMVMMKTMAPTSTKNDATAQRIFEALLHPSQQPIAE